MKWDLKEPLLGDMVRVKVGSIWHFGIYVSDDEVIQFGKNPSSLQDLTSKDVVVIKTSVEDFILGEFLQVAVFDKKEHKKKHSAKEIVEMARKSLGEGGYNILHNNCEHFVNKCVFGEQTSSQVDQVREFFKKMPILNVYYATKPASNKFGKILPKERQKEISQCSNENVRTDKYFVWKLLEYGLKNTFGYDIKKLDIAKNKNGKWECSKCFFSLSHSQNMLAVAISNRPVGVDVEIIKKPVVEGMEAKILNENELEEYSNLTKEQKSIYLIEKWTQKESQFKRLNQDAFNPAEMTLSCTQTEKILEQENEYFLSVSSEIVVNKKIIKVNL